MEHNDQVLQPLYDYTCNIIKYFLDDFTRDDIVDIVALKKQVYRYARKLGYGQGKHELECEINKFIIELLEVVREPGTNLGMKGLRDVQKYLLKMDKRKTL